MRSSTTVCVEEGRRSGRCSVRVGCCVSLLVVNMECRQGVLRASSLVNDDVAVKCGV